MNYATARPLIRSGDLLAWSHKEWGSFYDLQVQAVRFFTQSEFSHVGVAWRFGERVMVFESVSAGVRLFPLSRQVPFYWTPMPVEWNAAADAFAFETLGQPYSKLQAIAAQLGILKAGRDAVWECAEWAQACYQRLGLELKCKATPAALMEAALGLPNGVQRLVKED